MELLNNYKRDALKLFNLLRFFLGGGGCPTREDFIHNQNVYM